ncbi:MAG: hypothetical protein ACI9VM_000128 [Candidatus Azotimanducaceae bacterium]|jgi:hypothetical protein
MYLKRLLYSVCQSCRPNKSRTVRFAFPLVFSALAFVGAAAVLTSDGSSYIRIATNNSLVDSGEFFSIDVFVSSHVPVNAVDLAVSFPEDQIEIDGIDTGESVVTIWTRDPYTENGTVFLQGGTFRKGFLGEHLIATINARAISGGTAKFSVDDIRLLAGDGQGSTVSIQDTGYESLTVYVGEEAAESAVTTGTLEGALRVGIYTDIDGDGDVDIGDIRAFMSAWSTNSTKYDFNGDGKMSFIDFAIILADSFFK